MRWDIFCKVIDNYGDIGVCWRLAADLATRGEDVRLWTDDPSALAWLAPAGTAGVEVLRWTPQLPLPDRAPAEVIVEAFGCEVAPELIAASARPACAGGQKPVWINLEYLTAEPYAARCHGLPSPVMHGPAAGWTKWFFYPGFTPGTGGLLREPALPQRQAAFDRTAARAAAGAAPDTLLVTLFCYEPPALGAALQRLRDGTSPARLLALPGRAADAVRACGIADETPHGQLAVAFPPPRPQPGFDEWLWASDLNFVRGEDSLVRALWAGRPFVWHIYSQDDGAHAAKLDAFLDWMDAPPDLRRFHHVWNGLADGPLPAWDLGAWGDAARHARDAAWSQPDLVTQLMGFVAEKQ